MARSLELETLITSIVGDDEDYQRVLDHSVAATGKSAADIESKLETIAKGFEELGKVDMSEFEGKLLSLIETSKALREELKIDQIHSYADMVERAAKAQDSLSSFKGKTASSSASVDTLFTGGNKSQEAFKTATTSSNQFSAFEKHIPKAISSLEAFNNTLSGKTVSSLEAFNKATGSASDQFSAFNKATASNKSLDAWNAATSRAAVGTEKLNKSMLESIKVGQIFKFAVGFTVATAAHKIAAEIAKDVLGFNAFNKAMEKSIKLAQQLDYFRNREQNRRISEISSMDAPQRKVELQKDLPKAQQAFQQALLDKSRAQAEMDTFEGFGGDELFGTPQWKAAKAALEEAEKALSDARINVDTIKDSLTDLDRTAQKTGEATIRDLNIELFKLSEPHNAGIIDDIAALDEMVRSGKIAADQIAEVRNLMKEVRDKKAEKDFFDQFKEDQKQGIAENAEKENRDFKERIDFFKDLRSESQGFAAELKGVPRDIIAMDEALQAMKDKGIFSPEEIEEAGMLMKKNIQAQRTLADRKAGDPARLGVEGVEARSADAFARLRGQANAGKTPLDNINSNIEKQLKVMEEIRDKDPMEGFAAAGLT